MSLGSAYRRDGFVVVPDLLGPEALQELRAVIAELVAAAASVDTHTAVYDLEPGHTPAAPRVRRIKQPHKVHPAFDAVVRERAGDGDPPRAPRARPPAARLQAQHEVGRTTARRSSGTRTGRSTRTPTTTCWRSASCSTTCDLENGPLHGRARHAQGPGLEPPRRGRALRRAGRSRRHPGGDRQRGGADRPRRHDVVPPRARAARLGAQHLRPQPQSAALRVRRLRRLAAAGRGGLRRLQSSAAGRPCRVSSRA